MMNVASDKQASLHRCLHSQIDRAERIKEGKGSTSKHLRLSLTQAGNHELRLNERRVSRDAGSLLLYKFRANHRIIPQEP